MCLNLTEVLINESHIIGTLCIKTFYSEIPTNKIQNLLITKGNELLSIINKIKDHKSFLEAVETLSSDLNISINLPNFNKELIVKYSTDFDIINHVSPNQDQKSYDLGVMLYKTEKTINNNIYIITLTIPISYGSSET
jgi:hypothetical protein